MASLFETVERFFADEGCATVRLHTAEPSLRMDYQGEHAAWPCVARVREASGHITFYSVSAIVVPAERRPQVTELLTRVNFGLLLGSFEIDLDVGEIRFRTQLDLGPQIGAQVGTTIGARFAAMFGRVVGGNLATMDRYTPAIEAVLAGVAPAHALADLAAAR